MVFLTGYSYFKYQVILFGYFSALASFQSYFIMILVKKLDIFVNVYLHNIFICIKDLG